jgi:hypothetical protein
MDLVKHTLLRVTVWKAVDMSKAKNDAHSVNYSLNGKDCGVLAVDVY